MTIEFRIAQDADAQEWDKHISESPHGTLFHQWNWLKITEKYTQSKLYPLVGEKGNTIIGLIPLFLQKRGPIRMVFSPPPHAALFYLGPVIIRYNSLKQSKREINYIEFQNSVDSFITNELKAQYNSISLSPDLQDPRPYIWSGYTAEIHYDYRINLMHGCDYLLRRVDKNQRQNLHRAQKRGIIIEIGGKTEFEQILNLMDIRYEEQGKKVMVSRKYFLEIYDVFKENLKIFVAKVDREVVTGTIDFQYKDTHYSWIGNPKPKSSICPSPNDLLIWESIRYAYEKGFKNYITMNAAGDQRLHTYYASKFDPALIAHFSLKKHSYSTGIVEKIYKDITKPLKGKMNYFKSVK